MTDSTITLLVSIAGIVGTVISSALGLYFTARARTAPIREILYARQVSTVLTLLDLFGRARNFVVLVGDPPGEYRERARHDLGALMPRFGRFESRAAAILPTELYAEIHAVVRALHGVIEAVDSEATSTASADAFVAHTTKFALLARVFLGVDELSQENAELFTTKRDVERIAALGADYFLQLREHAREGAADRAT